MPNLVTLAKPYSKTKMKKLLGTNAVAYFQPRRKKSFPVLTPEEFGGIFRRVEDQLVDDLGAVEAHG